MFDIIISLFISLDSAISLNFCTDKAFNFSKTQFLELQGDEFYLLSICSLSKSFCFFCLKSPIFFLKKEEQCRANHLGKHFNTGRPLLGFYTPKFLNHRKNTVENMQRCPRLLHTKKLKKKRDLF